MLQQEITTRYVRRCLPDAEVYCASDPVGARVVLRAIMLDYVVTDMVLGLGSGLDVIREARRHGVPVVATSCIAARAPRGVPFVDKFELGARLGAVLAALASV